MPTSCSGSGWPIRPRVSGPTRPRCSERIELDRIRADGYGFQIEMTYSSKRAGASVREVPIRFVDRVEGESKMSTFIVVEAIGLVTWWGVRRLVGRLRKGSQPART